MDKLILLVFYLLIFSAFIRICLPYIFRSGKNRLLFLLVWSFILTFYSLCLFDKIPFAFSSEKSFIKLFSKSNNRYTDFVNTINQQFTLIDVSGSKELVSVYGSTSRKVAITDRKALFHFLSFLNKNPSLFSKVIIDIAFEQNTPMDDSLHHELRILNDSNKLLLAYSDDAFTSTNQTIYASLEKSFANVTEVPAEETFFSYTLFKNTSSNMPNASFSLPYRMYNHISETEYSGQCSILNLYSEKKLPSNSHFPTLGFRSFIPPVYIDTSQETILQQMISEVFKKEEDRPPSGLIQVKELITYSLGDLIDNGHGERVDELDFLGEHMSNIMQSGKNMVFIGSFSPQIEDEDTHSTILGRTHGSKILLNLYYQLQRDYNKNIFGKFIGLYLLLFLASATLLYKEKIEHIFKKIKTNFLFSTRHHRLNYKLDHIASFIGKYKLLQYLGHLLHFIFISELHYLFLLLMLFIFINHTDSGYILAILPFYVLFFLLETHLTIYALKFKKAKTN